MKGVGKGYGKIKDEAEGQDVKAKKTNSNVQVSDSQVQASDLFHKAGGAYSRELLKGVTIVLRFTLLSESRDPVQPAAECLEEAASKVPIDCHQTN